jgi:XTP/dITP diphosphohydrolase
MLLSDSNVTHNKERAKRKTIFDYFWKMKLIFATNNQHKLKEISHLLGTSFKLVSLSDIQFNEDIPENFPTLEENALFKARFINKLTGMNVFADDTGLEIDALNGKPGVHSARFAGPAKNFDANIDKVLLLLGGKNERRARFRTVIALIIDNNEYLFEGRISGTITRERRGKNGFGYDPVFIPEGREITFAEMSLDEKNMISHRAEAFTRLKAFLSGYGKSDNISRV